MTEAGPSDRNTVPGAPLRRRRFDRLSSRLFAFTLAAILLIEALVFIPSAANERTAWLQDRVEAGRLAALALDAAPMREVSDMLTKDLLSRAGVLAVAEIEDDMRMILLDAGAPVEGMPYEVDLRETTALTRSVDTFGAYVAPEDRILLIRDAGSSPQRQIEVVVPHAPLKAHLQKFFARIALLSLLIALLAASLIYFLLHRMVVQPMARVSEKRGAVQIRSRQLDAAPATDAAAGRDWRCPKRAGGYGRSGGGEFSRTRAPRQSGSGGRQNQS